MRLAVDGEVRLAPLRWRWVVAGLALLWVLVAGWNGAPPPVAVREAWRRRGGKLLAVAALWTAGLALAAGSATVRRRARQEGGIVTGVLVATGACMGALAIFVVWKSRRWRSAWLGELGAAPWPGCSSNSPRRPC